MDLEERSEEFSALHNLLTECLEGKEHVAVVRGAVATGKTALLHRFAEHAIGSGATFLSATASQGEQCLPLGVLGQLLRSASLSVVDNDRVTRLVDSAAINIALQPLESQIAADIPIPVLQGLRNVMHDLAKRTPVLIGIDDMHYADVPSLQCLLYLVRQLRTARVLVVFTECIRSQQAHPMFHAELQGQPYCRYLKLEPLSLPGVTSMISELLEPESAQRLSAPFHKLSGGNPLLLHALIADHRTDAKAQRLSARSGDRLSGDRFSQAVSSCLYRCEASMRNVARALAVLNGCATRGRLAEILGEDSGSIARNLSALSASGLLEHGRFRHDAVSAAVVDGMAAEERAAMHGRAAQVLYEAGLTARVVAKHLVAARDVSHPWAISVLQQAAEQEKADGDAAAAVRCLRLIRETCDDEAQRAAATSVLAGAEWQIDPSSVVRLLPELVETAQRGHLSSQQTSKLLTYLLWHGWADDAKPVAELLTSGAQASRAGKAEDLGDLEFWLSWVYPGFRYASSGRTAETAHSSIAASMAAMLAGEEVDGAMLIAAEQVLLNARLHATALAPVLAALAVLIYGGALNRASGLCHRLLNVAEYRGATTWRALLSAVLAFVDERRGNLPAAERHAQAALTLISPQSWGVAVGLPLSSMMLVTTARGKLLDAASLLDVAVPEEMFETICGPYYLRARGRYFLAVGKPHSALADFELCGNSLARWGLDQTSVIPWRTDVAESFLQMGPTAQAKEPLKRALPAAVLSREAPELPAPGPVSSELSWAEQRVAILAAEGRSNQQIASRLCITISTVEQHLTRVYRKLRVSRRTELATAMATTRR